MSTQVEHFAQYGFECPQFEAEILKEMDTLFGIRFVGYCVVDDVVFSCVWNENGTNIQNKKPNLNLKPLKKKWYQNKNNVGKLIINKYGEVRIIQHIDENKVSTHAQNIYHDDIRNWNLVTKDEALSMIGE